MPIIIHKDGWTNIRVALFVGPDREGYFPIYPDASLYDIPRSLDPLGESGIEALLNGVVVEEERNREVHLDYTDINPEKEVQILRVADGDVYSKKFYLSPKGNGGTLEKNLTHNLSPHQFEVVSLASLRGKGNHRRKREGDTYSGKVIGWETNEEFYQRKPKRERG